MSVSLTLTTYTQEGLFMEYKLNWFYDWAYEAMFDLVFAVLLTTDVYIFLIILIIPSLTSSLLAWQMDVICSFQCFLTP